MKDFLHMTVDLPTWQLLALIAVLSLIVFAAAYKLGLWIIQRWGSFETKLESSSSLKSFTKRDGHNDHQSRVGGF